MNVYSITLQVAATVYVKAASDKEAQAKAKALNLYGIEMKPQDVGSGLSICDMRFDDDSLPEVSIAPCMTIHGEWPDDVPELVHGVQPVEEPAVTCTDVGPTCFDYFEIRPCIEERDVSIIESFSNEEDFEESARLLDEAGKVYKVLWTIYGMEKGIATAIGDFGTKQAAHNVMNAILAPMAKARDLIRDGGSMFPAHPNTVKAKLENAAKAADDLEDFINQCSNSERI